ncbi:MAG TPA: lipoprotein [Candidatus Binatia bacterium]|jgi:predicted small lipoprotein YifL|nr:lipoprotein [Candidatus Binatia bacterium]
MRKFRVPSFEFSVKIFLIGTAVALALAGCGSKGPLRAPEGAVPEPIKELRAKAGKQGIDLTWPRPTRYVDGKELNDLVSFVIFRKEIAKSCPECPAPFRQLATVDVEDQQKFMKRKQFGYVDQAVQPQTVYRYRVFSKVADGTLSEPSNEVEVAWRSE